MKVDVVVCTYNSARFLRACLRSIVDNVPVRKLWVIDNYSTDETVKIAESFGAVVVQSRCSLAEARKLSFELAETEVFVSVDSDVVLSAGWFDSLMRYLRPNVGCVWGVTIDQHPLHKLYMLSMWKLRRAESYNIPHLPNMVARKSVLENIKYPAGILNGSVANEDWFIKFFIEGQGFKCVTAPVFCKHYSFPPQSDKSVWYGASSRVSGLESLKNLVLRFILSFPQGFYAAFASRNARVAGYWVKFRFMSLYGFLNYSRFYNLKRNKI